MEYHDRHMNDCGGPITFSFECEGNCFKIMVYLEKYNETACAHVASKGINQKFDKLHRTFELDYILSQQTEPFRY